jgi:hypothetical protein
MKNMLFVFIGLLCLTAITACEGGDREDLKSPCVGAEDSPCGEKRRVNDWWLA